MDPTWDATAPIDQPVVAQNVTQPQPNPGHASNIPTWDNTEDLKEKYGTLQQEILAGVESAASAATLGTSRHLENLSGLTTPEAQFHREKVNEIPSFIGNIVGTGALIGATGGVGSVLGEGATAAKAAANFYKTANLSTKIGAMGAEGAILGAGNAISDAAMGDPNINAQMVLAHVGMGAALGAGGGLLFEGILPGAKNAILNVPKKIGAVKEAMRRVYGAEKEAVSGTAEADLANQTGSILDAPQTPKKGVQNTTIQDIQNKVNEAKFAGNALEMPQKQELKSALDDIELSNPVHPMQMESLSNQRARDAYQTAKEMGDEGQALQQYEALQKGELVAKTANSIKEIAGDAPVTSDAVQGGNTASKYFTDQYQAEKKASGELVGAARSLDTQGVDHLNGVVNAMSDAVPQIGKMLDISDKGVKVIPYKTSMGLTKQTYSAVRDAITSLEENPQKFSDLFNIRKGLENGVNMFTSDAATQSEIRSLKASMMNYMQDMAGTELRDGFKRYAINEAEREVIEKVFGASVGSPEFRAISKVKPELIGDRIFSNTANVTAAKNILPKDKFNHLLANWIDEARAAATDKGAFSSNKFGSFLKRNQDSLNLAFSDNPAALKRLKDLTTIMRILPDSASVNPSGTAKTLINYLKESHSLSEAGLNALRYVKDKTMGKVESQIARENLDKHLSGKSADYSVKNAVSEIIKKTAESINSKSKAIFNSNIKDIARASGVVTADHYFNHVDNIKKLGNDPNSLFEHLDKTSEKLYSSIPNITQGLTSAISSGVQFLNSKLPKPVHELLLSQEWEPSTSQKEKFNRYYEAVNDPISSLKDIKNGVLSNETMEALQAVHPDLLQEMRGRVIENIDYKKAKNLNYSSKISLSKFLGQPVDNGLLPSVIQANQMVYNQVPQSQQRKQQNGTKSSASGLSKIDISQRSATRTERPDES